MYHRTRVYIHKLIVSNNNNNNNNELMGDIRNLERLSSLVEIREMDDPFPVAAP
jgi:hypothetical protein